MNYIKLFENYFKDKKSLMNQIDDIYYKINDIGLKFKDVLIDDLADVSDIPTVKVYPLMTLQDEIALNPEDGLETEYPENEVYVDIRFKFEYALKVFKSLRSFEKRYKNDYNLFYSFSSNVHYNKKIITHNDKYAINFSSYNGGIALLIDEFYDSLNNMELNIEEDLIKDDKISDFYGKSDYNCTSTFTITLREKK